MAHGEHNLVLGYQGAVSETDVSMAVQVTGVAAMLEVTRMSSRGVVKLRFPKWSSMKDFFSVYLWAFPR